MNSEELYFERERLLFDLTLLENPTINLHIGYGLRNRNNSARLNISDDEKFMNRMRELMIEYTNSKLMEL